MKRCIKHFVTCGQIKILERRADEAGLSYYQMMENAGSRAAEFILNMMSIDSAFVFCGKGNNGGDGFVVARLLAETGCKVTVILVDGQPVTDDSIANFELLKNLPVRILDMKVNDRALMELKGVPDIIVDAIYGTGFRGKLSGNGHKAAIYINRHHDKQYIAVRGKAARIVSLDVPSGVGGDLTNEKRLDKNCVRAHNTIVFHARKPVHIQKFAETYCGQISVADIGIDESMWYVETDEEE